MVKSLIICEGKYDRIFFIETLIKKLVIPPSAIKDYAQLDKFRLDVRNNNLKEISIIEGGGYPRYIKLSVRLLRQFWYEHSISAIGIIGDSDRGHVYNEIDTYLTQYLNTPCKKHNFDPEILKMEDTEEIHLILRRGRQITMWALQIPENLEKKMAILLKRIHTEFSANNPHDVIDLVKRKLNITIEDLIKNCVELAEHEQWFIDLIQRLRDKINIQ